MPGGMPGDIGMGMPGGGMPGMPGMPGGDMGMGMPGGGMPGGMPGDMPGQEAECRECRECLVVTWAWVCQNARNAWRWNDAWWYAWRHGHGYARRWNAECQGDMGMGMPGGGMPGGGMMPGGDMGMGTPGGGMPGMPGMPGGEWQLPTRRSMSGIFR